MWESGVNGDSVPFQHVDLIGWSRILRRAASVNVPVEPPHLLTRVDAGDRDVVFDRLATFVSPPDGVTREGIRSGNQNMLDRWWDDLGLQSVNWWRLWEQKWRQNRTGR